MSKNSLDKYELPPGIIALNYFTIIFLLLGISVAVTLPPSLVLQIVWLLVWIYLVPPLLCRTTIFFFGKPSGIVSQDSRNYQIWWLLLQYQLIFNRFPFLEDCLKAVPGLYAFWLNLWGARVSPFVFWGPGITVMDRYHLNIAKGVILGTECLLSGHAVKIQDDGRTQLAVDPITIDTGALIGVRAIISPGCHIHAFETVAAQKLLKPYTSILDGQKSQQVSNAVLYGNNS